MDNLQEMKPNNKNDLRVRIVLLPSYTVASYHYIGEDPEDHVRDAVDKFVRESNLYDKKPDSRFFGFNHPNPSPEKPVYGYEAWVTVPEDMEIPEPMVRKQMKSGLYVALTIDFPNFQEWALLDDWVSNSDIYEADCDPLGAEIMSGLLEEHLNWIYSSHMGWPENGIDGKLDLLFPIKKKTI